MTDVRQNKGIIKLNLILSILVAFGTWFYVVSEITPNVTKTYTDVAVECVGLDVLAEKGLGVESLSDQTIRIKAQLDRRDQFRTDSQDFKAVIDVSGASKGDNLYDIKVTGPSNASVTWQSVDSVAVKVAESLNKDVPVTAYFKDNGDSTREPYITRLDYQYVSIMGARSQAERVAYVAEFVDLTAAQTGNDDSAAENSIIAKPVALDAQGKIVDNIVIRPETLDMTYRSSMVKVVALQVKLEGEENEGLEFELPSRVAIKGLPKDVADINSVSATVDVSEVTEAGELELEYKLPDNVKIANKSILTRVIVKARQ